MVVRFFFVLVLLCGFPFKDAFASPVLDHFAPHRALYDVRLKSASSGSQIINISGKMFYELDHHCNAWSTKHRFDVKYDYADSPAIRITSAFANYESIDDPTLDFTVSRKQNGNEYDAIRGRATMSDDRNGAVFYTQPEGLNLPLPAGTQYPVAHTANVIEALLSGKRFYNAIVFDGSDADGAVEINAFVRKTQPKPLNSDNTTIDKTLLEDGVSHVQLAFFPLAQPNAQQPDYEMDVVLHYNGIIKEMVINYDDFSVSQELLALEKIEHKDAVNSCQ